MLSHEAGEGSKSLRDQVSDAEWAVRKDLAACYRLLNRFGMTDLIFNHISAIVPDSNHILINAYGLLYDEITASNLYKIDLNGQVVLEPAHCKMGVNYGGQSIHTAIHRSRKDAFCIIHTHTRAGMALSAMDQGLLPLTQHALRFYNQIGYHDYGGVDFGAQAEAQLAVDLGSHDALIMRNHGLLVCGPTIAEAFDNMYTLEIACKVQVDVMQSSVGMKLPAESVWEKTAIGLQRHKPVRAQKVWAALIRKLDLEEPSYST